LLPTASWILDLESPTNFTERSFQMTTYQLLRIIWFLERVRGSFQEILPCAEEDASWNIVLYIIKQNLLGSKVTFTSLSSTAKVPYATAMRRVHDLIDQGHIMRVPISDTGKRFRLVASQPVLTAFDNYAKIVKSLLNGDLGIRDDF
jgi:multiple sugar transport system substrate-binding protein